MGSPGVGNGAIDEGGDMWSPRVLHLLGRALDLNTHLSLFGDGPNVICLLAKSALLRVGVGKGWRRRRERREGPTSERR